METLVDINTLNEYRGITGTNSFYLNQDNLLKLIDYAQMLEVVQSHEKSIKDEVTECASTD